MSSVSVVSPVVRRNRIKRVFSEIFSPVDVFPVQTESPKLHQMTKKKLLFSLSDSPVPPSAPVIVDENSCDSGVGENDIQDLTSSDIIDSKNLHGSPLTQLNNLQNNMHRSMSTQFFNRPHTNLAKKHKSETFNEEAIKKALEKIEGQFVHTRRLIGDFSRPHTLPVMSSSKHNDLASITPSTLASVLNGDYKQELGDYVVLDARYPYEFEGGHIENAESAYVKEKLFHKLFNSQECANKVLIIHCEFSSERGPKLMRAIREHDRLLNKQNYPSLNYPEMYLLEGGYKSFYENHVDMCEPKSYLPMHHDNHRQDLKYFRSKSKSWDCETKKRLSVKSKLSF